MNETGYRFDGKKKGKYTYGNKLMADIQMICNTTPGIQTVGQIERKLYLILTNVTVFNRSCEEKLL